MDASRCVESHLLATIARNKQSTMIRLCCEHDDSYHFVSVWKWYFISYRRLSCAFRRKGKRFCFSSFVSVWKLHSIRYTTYIVSLKPGLEWTKCWSVSRARDRNSSNSCEWCVWARICSRLLHLLILFFFPLSLWVNGCFYLHNVSLWAEQGTAAAAATVNCHSHLPYFVGPEIVCYVTVGNLLSEFRRFFSLCLPPSPVHMLCIRASAQQWEFVRLSANNSIIIIIIKTKRKKRENKRHHRRHRRIQELKQKRKETDVF